MSPRSIRMLHRLALATSIALVFAACRGEDPLPDGGASDGGANDGAANDGAANDGGVPPDGATEDGAADGGHDADDPDGSRADGGATPARRFVLDEGHIDLFEVTYDPTLGTVALAVKDDTQLYGPSTFFRDPEDVTLAYDAARVLLTLPEGLPDSYAFLGRAGDTIYLADWVQMEGVPWAGWSTQRLASTLPEGLTLDDAPDAVRLTVAVEGPGDVFTFMNDGFGDASNRYVDTTDTLPDVIPIAASTHVHTSWAFTALGDYTLTVTPSVTTSAGVLTGRAYVYHVHLGDPLFAPTEVELVLGGGGDYTSGTTVQLEANVTPASGSDTFGWYRWTEDGYVVLDPTTGPTVSVVATTAALYLVCLFDEHGRVRALTTAHVNVLP